MFLVFTGDSYYPGGGWKDYKGSACTLEDAITLAANTPCDWWHIVAGGVIVRSGGRI